MAKRLRPSTVVNDEVERPPLPAAVPPPAAAPPPAVPPLPPSEPDSDPPPNRRRRFILAGAAATLVVAGIIAAIVVMVSDSGGPSGANNAGQTQTGIYNANGPWRMLVKDVSQGTDLGCSFSITDPQSGATILLAKEVFAKAASFQVLQAGAVHWQLTAAGCLAVPVAGSGNLSLPAQVEPSPGQTDAFTAPDLVSVQVTDFNGDSTCTIKLYDPSNAQLLDSGLTAPGNDTVKLDPQGAKTAYVYPDNCGVRISAAR